MEKWGIWQKQQRWIKGDHLLKRSNELCVNGLFILLHDYYLAIRLVYDSYVRLRLK